MDQDMTFITDTAVVKITLDLWTNEHANNSSHQHWKRVDFPIRSGPLITRQRTDQNM